MTIKMQPGRYEEITCQLCGVRTEYGEAFDKLGWFDVSGCYMPGGYFDDELEDGYLCFTCGSLNGFEHCCFCGMTMREPFTNNPAPYFPNDEEARCCSGCNGSIVIPARLRMLHGESEAVE